MAAWSRFRLHGPLSIKWATHHTHAVPQIYSMRQAGVMKENRPDSGHIVQPAGTAAVRKKRDAAAMAGPPSPAAATAAAGQRPKTGKATEA